MKLQVRPRRNQMKRRRRLDSSPSIPSIVELLPHEILTSIFNKLDFIDLVQARSACSSWNSVGQDLVSKIPWLMLPSKLEVEDGCTPSAENNGYNGFLNLCEIRVYNMKTTPDEFRESCCIGSSHGWLVFLEQKAVPFLSNPFRQVKIQFPSVDRLLGLKKMESNMNGGYELDYFKDNKNSRFLFRCGKHEIRENFVQKAILTGAPESNNGNYGLILLCNNGEEIAYCESGAHNSWTVLDVSHPPYQDIICHENNLYALSNENSIEVWDLRRSRSHIVKKSDIVLQFPNKSLAIRNSLRVTCTFYLVESCGDLLLVVRFIGDYVDWTRTPLPDWERETDYGTVLFHVYKLDSEGLKWMEVESLGDRALFLGGNQYVSVSTLSSPDCKNNCIYFTDDNWGRMDEYYSYGGHDMGIYNLKDGSFKSIYDFSSDSFLPAPCWIIPPAMLEP